MELTEKELIKKYGTFCKHCNRNCLEPNEYKFICISCNYNVIKRKIELCKFSRKKSLLTD